jgi:hypothetical protein
MAWNLAGFSRNSLISSSSSTASSAPATSANVVLGVSLVISLALDLPNCMTREPPPCIWLKKKRKTATSRMIGSSVSNSPTNQLCRGTLSVKVSLGGFSLSRAMMSLARASTYSVWILSLPWTSTPFFRVSSSRWSRSTILACSTRPSVMALRATSVSTFLNPPAAEVIELIITTAMMTSATQTKGPRK